MLLPPLRQFGKVKRRGVSFTSKSAGVVVPRLARVAAGNVTVRTQRVPLPLSSPLTKTSPYFSLFTLRFCQLARRLAKSNIRVFWPCQKLFAPNLHGAQPQSSARISKRLPAAAAATPAPPPRHGAQEAKEVSHRLRPRAARNQRAPAPPQRWSRENVKPKT